MTAVYILNRSMSRSLAGGTPFQAWYGRKPSVHYFRTFGCLAMMKKLGPGSTKLTGRSTKTILLGYEEGSKAYRVYDPGTKKLHVTRDVAFDEQQHWNWEEFSDYGQCEGELYCETYYQISSGKAPINWSG